MKITSYFERVYIINLAERKDRRDQMVRELEKIQLSPSSGLVEFFPAIRPSSAGEFPSIGARGCFMSHLAVLKKAQADGLKNVLILEDDLAFSKVFIQSQTGILQHLQMTSWDFVFFGHSVDVPDQMPVGFIPFPGQSTMTCLHFYGIDQAIYTPLISFLDEVIQRPAGHPLGGAMHLDGAYNVFRRQNPHVKALIAAPNLGSQRSSRSDIAPAKWYDRTPGIQELAGFARSAKALLAGA